MSTRTSILKRFDELIEFGAKLKQESYPDFLPKKRHACKARQIKSARAIEKILGGTAIS